jgi:mRNA interferase MazF
MAMEVKQFDVFLTNLDSTVSSEIQKTHPCLIVSPDKMNRNIQTVIVAPMTTAGKDCPPGYHVNSRIKKDRSYWIRYGQ